MILVDIPRGSKTSPQYQNQAQLRTLIRAMGILCEHTPLSHADACFEGNGPDGIISVGIEVKRLHDLLNCIDDAHFSDKQRLGMKKMYTVSILLVEGMWRPHENGVLMESRDGCQWWPCRPHGRSVMYSKIRRYLISVRYTGVVVNFTRNIQHTAYDIHEEYQYHQKKWQAHTSMREINKLAIPQLSGKPSLVRKWASDIEGIGVKHSEEAEKMFRKPVRLANSDEIDWMRLGGIGVRTAQEVVKQIHGIK